MCNNVNYKLKKLFLSIYLIEYFEKIRNHDYAILSRCFLYVLSFIPYFHFHFHFVLSATTSVNDGFVDIIFGFNVINITNVSMWSK